MQFVIQIFAMFWAPIVAVEVTRRLNIRKEERGRRQQLFNTLMTTSGDFGSLGRLSQEHVRALNLIEIEFYGEKYKSVIDAWRAYLACLNGAPTENWTPENAEVWDEWNKRRDGLLVKLLYAMAHALGYGFLSNPPATEFAFPVGGEQRDPGGCTERTAAVASHRPRLPYLLTPSARTHHVPLDVIMLAVAAGANC